LKAKVTSFDVARRAGVSRATVSTVLNRSTKVSISAETREKVLRAAKELGYRPNSAGRMLVRGQSETIALVLSDSEILLSDVFIPHILHGIGVVNREFGYHVLVDGVSERGNQTTYRRLAEARRIDGMIVLNPRTEDAELRELIDGGFPIVLIGSIRHPEEYSVNFSTRAGITAAVEHLVSLGHTRFGMVPFSHPGLVATDVRVAVMKTALDRSGLRLDADAVEYAEFSSRSGYEAVQRLLDRRPDLTAILAGNDTIALGVISALQKRGLAVPGDISVVGFDDLPFARFLTPPLTTIRTDGVDVGSKAARLLVRRLRGETVETHRLDSPTEFVVRRSTGPAAQTSPTAVRL
jgi:LacI family transcriptional regulator